MPFPPGVTDHKPRLRRLLLLALVAMMVLHAWVFFTLRQEVRQGYPDFSAFYAGGKCVREGLGSQLYDATTQARLQNEFASQVKIRQGPLPFTHPPFEAPLFVPLTLLSYPTAYWMWNALSLLMLVAFVLLLRPYLPRLRAWSEALPFLAGLAFFPVFVCLLQGQDSLLLLLLLGLAFAAMKGGSEFLAGICFGLALFRFQLVLPVMVVVLARRRRKLLGGFAVAALALGGVSAAVVGWSGLWNYPHQLLQLSRMQAATAMNPKNMPNLRGVISALTAEGAFAHGLVAVVSLALLGWAAWKWKADAKQPGFDLGFGLMIAIAVLVSYHLMAHDLSVLLIPLLLAAEWLLRVRAPELARRLVAAAVGLMFLSPIYFLLWFRYQHFSLLFWGVVLLAAGLSLALASEQAPPLAQAAGSER